MVLAEIGGEHLLRGATAVQELLVQRHREPLQCHRELAATQLQGGRRLGPLERDFILARAMGGHVTAASIVVAAKGLLRFPELSSRQEQATVHEMTEYFLLGSFVSWLVALGSYVLLV